MEPGQAQRQGRGEGLASGPLCVSLCLRRPDLRVQPGTGTHTALPTGAAGGKRAKSLLVAGCRHLSLMGHPSSPQALLRPPGPQTGAAQYGWH